MSASWWLDIFIANKIRMWADGHHEMSNLFGSNLTLTPEILVSKGKPSYSYIRGFVDISPNCGWLGEEEAELSNW